METKLKEALSDYIENGTAPEDVLKLYANMEASISDYCQRREDLAFEAGFKKGVAYHG